MTMMMAAVATSVQDAGRRTVSSNAIHHPSHHDPTVIPAQVVTFAPIEELAMSHPNHHHPPNHHHRPIEIPAWIWSTVTPDPAGTCGQIVG